MAQGVDAASTVLGKRMVATGPRPFLVVTSVHNVLQEPKLL